MAAARLPQPRIEDYALIGDMQTAALVSRAGSIDWLCLPRFDSDAVFAALLGDGNNGCWRLHPAGAGQPATLPGQSSRAYLGDTLVLTTTWQTPTGSVQVEDFMPPRGEDTPVLIRIVRGMAGSVEMECEIKLRFGYGRIVPWVRRTSDSLHAIAGPDSVWISTPIRLVGRDFAHKAMFPVRAGEEVPFMLTWQPSHHQSPPPDLPPAVMLERTSEFWANWVAQCTYEGKYREAVVRSLITVKALTYEPTGGIVAAPTTSLPEDLGGVRNWDYRYCWLRDATICLEALLRTGYTQEATAWRAWLGRAVAGMPGDVQIMYGVAGERRLNEWVADWLPGYEGSAPVRIGNAAVGQFQLDVYGEVVDAIALARRAGLPYDRHWASLIDQLVDFVAEHWHEPDEGIWEVRGPRRHFVHSKIMAWVALERRITMAESELITIGTSRLATWREARAAIHAQVCERGYDAARGTFTQYYGSSELDAAVLLIPEVGFLPADDPRVVSTVHTIARELTREGLVLRYSQPDPGQGEAADAAVAPVDGLPGGEGAFLACSFWLVNALSLIGEFGQATDLFERLLRLRSDVGLLSEEYDPRYGRQVGNSPQAFSHVPLIQAALNLSGHAPEHCRWTFGRPTPPPDHSG
jgi:GH15 family glucan-1,4-alpha-glucosidase